MRRDRAVNLVFFGLSLTDLILVFLIIAILVAILLPPSLAILEKARRTADQANARLLYQATVFYAAGAKKAGTVDPSDLMPLIGNQWPAVMSKEYSGRFSCEIESDGQIVVTTGTAVYDPASGFLLNK